VCGGVQKDSDGVPNGYARIILMDVILDEKEGCDCGLWSALSRQRRETQQIVTSAKAQIMTKM
jgi:hypothetical protein